VSIRGALLSAADRFENLEHVQIRIFYE
jgi:hypothetical protein